MINLKGMAFLISFSFAHSAVAAPAPSEISPENQRFLFEVAGGDHLPKWFPKESSGIFEEALKESVLKRSPSEEGGASQDFSPLVGHFSRFYISNADAYREVCYKALSFGQCRELIWSKTEELIALKLHASAENAVNKLLFLKNNPHLDELKIPLTKTRESLGLEKGTGLAKYLESFLFEFNSGGFKTRLINEDENYKELIGLLGRTGPEDMANLLLDPKAKKPFQKKLKQARAIFDLEWKLFVNNVFWPQTLLTSLEKAGEKAYFMTPKEVRPKISSMAFGLCESAPLRILNSPEVGVFCRYLHQNS